MKNSKTGFMLLALALMLAALPATGYAVTGDLLANEIEWRLSANRTPLQSTVLPLGTEFVFDTADAPSGLVSELDGIRLSLPQPPAVSGSLVINVTLNTQGDSFTGVSGYTCSFNMTVEVLVDGRPVEHLPVVMTIPAGAALGRVTMNGAILRADVAFIYTAGGIATGERIDTFDQVQGLVVHFLAGASIVGGNRTDLGVPASVGYSTWYKIKKLFE